MKKFSWKLKIPGFKKFSLDLGKVILLRFILLKKTPQY